MVEGERENITTMVMTMRMRIITANDIYYVLTLASEPYKY